MLLPLPCLPSSLSTFSCPVNHISKHKQTQSSLTQWPQVFASFHRWTWVWLKSNQNGSLLLGRGLENLCPLMCNICLWDYFCQDGLKTCKHGFWCLSNHWGQTIKTLPTFTWPRWRGGDAWKKEDRMKSIREGPTIARSCTSRPPQRTLERDFSLNWVVTDHCQCLACHTVITHQPTIQFLLWPILFN